MKHPHRSGAPRVLVAGVAACLAGLAGLATAAAPYYVKRQVLVPPDQWQTGGTPPQLTPAPVYKPHDARTTDEPSWWASSNERTGCAGISTFESDGNTTLANVIIDEPDVEYAGGDESAAPPCVGSIEPPPAVEPPEGEAPGPEDQFPYEARFDPTVCLPVVLPPGQNEVTYPAGDYVNEAGEIVAMPAGTVSSPGDDALGRKRVCAPLGAEQHARHPHGPTIYWAGARLYQVIEHSGLRWNANRTAIEIANTTDEESGFTVEWDVSDPNNPTVINGYINGHGAHEIAVNQNNGLVFQGNHEDSPGVYPPNWVDVIDPGKSNPYGFIDTGYFNAIQGVDVDEAANEVRGASHVGETVWAFDGSCVPTANPSGVPAVPAPPGYSLPAGDNGMVMGWNCVKWWTDIRPAFVAAFPNLSNIFAPLTPDGLPLVLHQHNLAMNSNHQPDNQNQAGASSPRSYSAIHSIHDAEHTGLSDEEPPPGASEEEEGAHHFMARYVAEVGQPTAVNGTTKEATVAVNMIDLSHGFDILRYPNVEDITGGLRRLQNSFVHAHFLWTDPARNLLMVTGEHTGNVGVVRTDLRQLKDVYPISVRIKGCTPPPPEPGAAPESEEPHVHGVVIQPLTGAAYVSDEGEHCFYESVTVFEPNSSPSQK